MNMVKCCAIELHPRRFRAPIWRWDIQKFKILFLDFFKWFYKVLPPPPFSKIKCYKNVKKIKSSNEKIHNVIKYMTRHRVIYLANNKC